MDYTEGIIRYAIDESNINAIGTIEKMEILDVSPIPSNYPCISGELENDEQGRANLELAKSKLLDALNQYIVKSIYRNGISYYFKITADISNNPDFAGPRERFSEIWRYLTNSKIKIAEKLRLNCYEIDFNLLINPDILHILTGSEINGIRVEEERLNKSGTKIRYTVNKRYSYIATMNRYVQKGAIIIIAKTRLPLKYPVYKFTCQIKPVNNKSEKLFFFHGNVINPKGIGIIDIKS